MIYEIVLTYFILRFTAELLLMDDIPETYIRCGCEYCSGIQIIN